MSVIKLPTARAGYEVDQPEISPLPVSVAGPTKAVLITVLVALAGVTLWSVTAPLSRGAVVMGQVQVENNRKTIQQLDGGVIKSILVRDGQMVHRGQVLIQLDGSRLKSAYKLLHDKMDEDFALEARLISERDGRSTIQFPEIMVASARNDFTLAGLMNQQRVQFAARHASQAGQVLLLKQTVDQYKQQIHGYEAQIKSKSVQVRLLERELAGLQGLYKQGLATMTSVVALERDLAETSGAKASGQAQIATAKVAIGQTEMQILQSRRSFLEDVVDKLRQVDSDVLDTRDRMVAQEGEIGRLEIRSPIAGQVVGLAVHTQGGVISAGQPLMDIIPVDDRMVISVDIPPTDIEHVKVGLPAEVRLPALRQRTAPTLMGSVTTMSTDTVTDPVTHQAFYTARVEIPNSELAKLGTKRLLAGMPAEVLIQSGQHTVLGYLMSPILDAMFQSFHQD